MLLKKNKTKSSTEKQSILLNVETLHAAFSTKCNFRWHDLCEAPSATVTEFNELSPVAAGGEEVGRRTPAVVINDTMSNDYRLTSDAFWGSLEKATGLGEVCTFLNIVESLRPSRCRPHRS